MRVLFCQLLLSAFLCVLAVSAGARPALVINTSIKPPLSTEQQDGYLDTLLFELFQRVGRDIAIRRMPAERSLHEVAEGRSDADIPRIAGLEKFYPSLVRMPEPVVEYRFSAFVKRPDITITSWDDLRRYRVGYIIGWKIFEANIPEASKAVAANDRIALFKMLQAGRIDVALHERLLGISTAKELGMFARPISPPLSQKDMYLYMNRRYEHMVRDLSYFLRQMRDDGTLERIAQNALPDGEACPLPGGSASDRD